MNIRTRRGSALVYVTIGMVVLIGFASLAVDYARVQLVKGELQVAADAAARHAVTGLRTSTANATANAVAAAGQNNANGTAVVLDIKKDIEFGVWDSATRTFNPLQGAWQASATAVRITARRDAQRGTGVGMIFAGVLGVSSLNVTAEAIGAISKDYTFNIPATGCPWLAGMPNGTHISGAGQGVYAPQNSPTPVTSVPIIPGSILNFRNTNGVTGDTATGKSYGLDGDPSRTQIKQASVNGINSTTAPLNSLVGIFLDDNAPNTTPAAAALDFSTTASRDFKTLSPNLKQVFFIGDGLDSSKALQDFVVPTGAKRLYLGVMDENAYWWDNVGSIATTLYDSRTLLVK